MQAPLVENVEGDKRFLSATTSEDVHKIVARMFWLEYVSVPVFYYLGYAGLNEFAGVLTIVYGCVSAFVQYDVARSRFAANRPRFWNWAGYEVHDEPLERVMGVPVGWAGRQKWEWTFVSVAPNYMHVLSTAVAVGSSWASWSCLRASYAAHWSAVPLVGGAIGAWGLPGVLTGLLALNFLVHAFCFFFYTWRLKDRCDAANLLFLGRMLEEGWEQEGGGASLVRALAAPFSKLPMLWCKVSLLALSWDVLPQRAKLSMLVAVGLGVYAVVPVVMPAFYFAIKEKDPTSIGFCLAYVPYAAIVGSHLLGIWLCPSHDFSIVHGGCTAPVEMGAAGCHLAG